jgi:Arc/MetJ-type ribon-helix-helix transcriptional regulator
MPNTRDLNHFLQLRLSKHTVAEIDDAIAMVPQLCGYNRCHFIRKAVRYALASIEEEARRNQNEPIGEEQA